MDPFIIGISVITVPLVLGLFWLAISRRRGTGRDLRPYLTFGGFGTPAVNQGLDGVRAARDLGITQHILIIPAVDLNDSTSTRGLQRLLPKRKLILPTRSERRLWGLQNDQQLVNEAQGVLNRLITRVNDRISHLAHQLQLREALSFPSVSWQGGHRMPSRQAMRERRRMLPGEIIVPIMVMPDQPQRRNATRDNPRFAVELVEEGVAMTTIIADNGSEMVRSQRDQSELETEREVRGRGMAAADHRLMVAISSLVAAPWHFGGQTSTADAIRDMASYGKLTGWSFGCHHLQDPEEHLIKKTWRRLRRKRPQWLFADVELAVRLAVEDALNIHPGNSTVDAKPRDWPAGRALTITVPIRLGDRGWTELRTRINNWLRDAYPYLTIEWASGRGAPEFGAEHYPYHVQASCWWALDEEEIPDPIQILMKSQDMRVRRTPALREGGQA